MKKRKMSTYVSHVRGCSYMDADHDENKKYIEFFIPVKFNGSIYGFRIISPKGDKNNLRYTIKEARFYEIQKEGKLSIGTSKDAHITDNLPFKIRISDLLKMSRIGKEGHI